MSISKILLFSRRFRAGLDRLLSSLLIGLHFHFEQTLSLTSAYAAHGLCVLKTLSRQLQSKTFLTCSRLLTAIVSPISSTFFQAVQHHAVIMAAESSPERDGSDPPNNKSDTSTQIISDDVQLEKALARVAEIVGKAFLHFRENTYDQPIDRVVEKPGQIISYDGDGAADYKFYPFPEDLVLQESTKNALLVANTCNDAAGFMYNMLIKLFDGTYLYYVY
jgi:hypothetical protein